MCLVSLDFILSRQQRDASGNRVRFVLATRVTPIGHDADHAAWTQDVQAKLQGSQGCLGLCDNTTSVVVVVVVVVAVAATTTRQITQIEHGRPQGQAIVHVRVTTQLGMTIMNDPDTRCTLERPQPRACRLNGFWLNVDRHDEPPRIYLVGQKDSIVSIPSCSINGKIPWTEDRPNSPVGHLCETSS